jgi:hypothetical protein
MHDYHDGLPGFSGYQMLHDGCGECESRAASSDHGIGTLDKWNFERAWRRSALWNRNGVTDLSHAERPMLTVLWSVQVQLERHGAPIGEVPRVMTLSDEL